MYLRSRCGLKAQFRVNKLRKPCTAHRTTHGRGNVRKARTGNLAKQSGSAEGDLHSHDTSLPSNYQPLSPDELSAFNSVIVAVAHVEPPSPLAIESDTESLGEDMPDQEECHDPVPLVGVDRAAGFSDSD